MFPPPLSGNRVLPYCVGAELRFEANKSGNLILWNETLPRISLLFITTVDWRFIQDPTARSLPVIAQNELHISGT